MTALFFTVKKYGEKPVFLKGKNHAEELRDVDLSMDIGRPLKSIVGPPEAF